MTKSMTAFTRHEAGSVSWEIRSVNHRYLDTTFKIPETFRSIEPELRTVLRGKLNRGKVDCLLRVNYESDEINELSVNESELRNLVGAIKQVDSFITKSIPQIGQTLNTLELLRWPGILSENEIDQTAIEDQIKTTFKDALTSLLAMRDREGSELQKIILGKLHELEIIVQTVRADAPIISQRQKNKLDDKLAELQIEVDHGRLEQELVYLAQKADITEEIDRLDTHVEEVRSALQQKGAVGRRLDFLMQELNREANTLSSKAVAANTSIQAVELKVIIEQMREQVQNIE